MSFRRCLIHETRKWVKRFGREPVANVLRSYRLSTSGGCFSAIEALRRQFTPPTCDQIHHLLNLCHKLGRNPPSAFEYNTRRKVQIWIDRLHSKILTECASP